MARRPSNPPPGLAIPHSPIADLVPSARQATLFHQRGPCPTFQLLKSCRPTEVRRWLQRAAGGSAAIRLWCVPQPLLDLGENLLKGQIASGRPRCFVGSVT